MIVLSVFRENFGKVSFLERTIWLFPKQFSKSINKYNDVSVDLVFVLLNILGLKRSEESEWKSLDVIGMNELANELERFVYFHVLLVKEKLLVSFQNTRFLQ